MSRPQVSLNWPSFRLAEMLLNDQWIFLHGVSRSLSGFLPASSAEGTAQPLQGKWMKGEGCPGGICSLAGSSKSSTTLRFLVLLLGLEKQHLFMLQVLVKRNLGPIFSGKLHRIYARKKGYFWFKQKKKQTKPRTYCHFLFVACSLHWGGNLLTFCVGVFRFSWSLFTPACFK